MKRLTISVYNAKGRAELRYTKTLSGKTVNLAIFIFFVPLFSFLNGTDADTFALSLIHISRFPVLLSRLG